ncbi:S-adenosyl-L-methionine-dependent methyltransferase [Xylariales sp. PMI_506]|nr:S-adenosyl-L-methionine-dependent methyltransferase [Xylariales sp. PMI_506]
MTNADIDQPGSPIDAAIGGDATNRKPANIEPENENPSWSLPTLPSQLLGSYSTVTPPPWFYTEDIPTSAGYVAPESNTSGNHRYRPDLPQTTYHDAEFATTANHLINQILQRTPSGGSVVEPDSMIGESGRLYHGYKEGKYFLPNDAAEQDRLDLQHEIVRLMFDGWLALAPLPTVPKNVLDIGTGTGIWALEFAEQNPQSNVIGTDLSAIQPLSTQPNCTFVKTDAEDEWIFPDPNSNHSDCNGTARCEHKIVFDYVHMRFMFTCFNDPKTVLQQAFDNLGPGGWLECQEAMPKAYQANPTFPGNAYQRWADTCIIGAAAAGRDIEVILKYEGWLKEIGFTNITVRQFLVPTGGWHHDPHLKKIGEYNLQNMSEGIRGIGWKMLRSAGMSPEAIESLVPEVLREIHDKSSQYYGICHVIYARKPLLNEQEIR